MRVITFLTLILLVTSKRQSFADLFRPIDAPNDYAPTAEQLKTLLNVEESSNGIIEDTFVSILKFAKKIISKVPTLEKLTNIGITDECKAKGYGGPQILKFFPAIQAKLKDEKPVSFENGCFKNNTISLKFNEEKGEADVIIESSDAESLLCFDFYFIHTSNRQYTKTVAIRGKHAITLRNITEEDKLEIKVSGVRVFTLCESLEETIESLYITGKFVVESLIKDLDHSKYPYYINKPQEQVEWEHMEFLRDYGGFEIQNRTNGTEVLDIQDSIQSGDFIGTAQIDSFTSLLNMFFTGGFLSHSAFALRVPPENKLYVVEMREVLYYKTWEQFIERQKKKHNHFVVLPLKDEYRKQFNSTAADEFIKKNVSHLLYGISNVLFSAIDTENDNGPDYVPKEIFMLLTSLIDKFFKFASDMLFNMAMNNRLNTTKLNTHEIVVEAAKKNLTYEQLMAMPEDDNYKYLWGYPSIICSGLAMLTYRAGGMLKDVNFNAAEFTPIDVALVDLYNKTEWKDNRPEICKKMDPDLPYCQGYGRYRLLIKNYSSVKPFDHMMEKCATKPKEYLRDPMC